jgi:hypothetical protein
MIKAAEASAEPREYFHILREFPAQRHKSYYSRLNDDKERNSTGINKHKDYNQFHSRSRSLLLK